MYIYTRYVVYSNWFIEYMVGKFSHQVYYRIK